MSRDLGPILSKIKASVNILEVIGEHVVLRKSGANYTGLCPFHAERSPSFSVSETKQLFHCYGCKKGGDLVTFVMDMSGLSFAEAIEDLAERAKIPASELSKDAGFSATQSVQAAKAAKASKLNRFVASYFHHHLSQDPKASAYLKQRGVTPAQIQEFYIGSAPEAWEALAQHLTKSQAPLDLAAEIGLIRPSTKGQNSSGYFDLFRSRVLFPIINLRGKVSGFGGRILTDENPKYLNSPDSLIFQKSKLAFGLFQAQKYIREQDEVILVEGYFDVLGLHRVGQKNVVSTCGTALTSHHLRIFSRLASRIVILFDGDQAGIDATERAMLTGLEAGHILYGASLPKDTDPDQFVIDGVTGEPFADASERLSAFLKSARPILDVRIEEEMRQAQKGPEDRVQALKKIGYWLNRLSDPVGRAVRQQWVEKEMKVPKRILLDPSLRPQEGVATAPPPSKPTTPVSSGPPAIPEGDRVTLRALSQGRQFVEYFQSLAPKLPPGHTSIDLVESAPAREVLSLILSGVVAGGATQMETLDPGIRSLLTSILMGGVSPEVSLADFQTHLKKRVTKIWARVSHVIRAALSKAEKAQDASLQDRLMKEYLDLRRKMNDFNSFYDEE